MIRKSIFTIMATGIASAFVSAQTLEEVLVTAQKREQSLQEAPVSIQALNAEGLDKAGISSIEDMEQLSPSLMINSGTGNMQPVIRGVGSNLAGGGGYSSVATYIDGAYIPRMTSTNAALGDFDFVDSVQLLKGPQGTLYGRNATGGAIVVTTLSPKPEDDLSARVKVTLGEYGMQKYLVSASGGLTENLAGFVAYTASETDGYIENEGGIHNDDFELEDRESWRLKLVGEFDKVEMELSALYGESFDRFHGTQQVGQQDSQLRNAAFTGFGLNNPQAFFFATASQIYNPTNDPATAGLFLTAAQSLQFTDNYGKSYDNTVGAYNRGVQVGDYDELGTGSYTEDLLSSFKFVYHFDKFDLVSLTAYNDTQSDMQADILRAEASSIPAALAGALPFQTIAIGFGVSSSGDSVSQEINLVSTDGEFDWIIGLSYFKEDGINTLSQDAFDISFVNADTEWDVEATSIFGEVTIPLAEYFKGILGARYTEEELTLTDKINPANIFGIPNVGELEQDDAKATYTAKLIYEQESYMLYGGVTTGFKGGALNANNPLSGGVDPEEITSYEVGLKSEWLNNTLRFNANIFLYDYSNLQLDVVEPNTGSAYLIDGTEAEILGLELDINYVATSHLVLYANAAFMSHEYTSDAEVNPLGLPSTTVPLEGNEMAMASDSVATIGFDYSMPWIMHGDLSFSTNARYNSGYWIDQRNIIGSQGSDDNGSFTVINMNLRYVSADQQWNISVWANNVFDEEYYSGGFVISDGLSQNVVAARPAWFGVTGEVQF